jgi:hypothetical protein
VSIGETGGSGAGLIRLDLDDSEVVLELIKSTGSQEPSRSAVELINRNEESTVMIYGGDFALVENSIIRSLFIRGGDVLIEDNCELVGVLDVTGGSYTAPKAQITEIRDRR